MGYRTNNYYYNYKLKMSKNKRISDFLKGISERMLSVRVKMKTIREERLKRKMNFKKATVPKLGHDGENKMVVEFSVLSAVKVMVVVLIMVALMQFINEISGILLIFFVSFLLAASLDPLIDWMEERKIPRVVGVLVVYMVVFLLVGVFATKVAVLVAEQVAGIAQSVGQFVAEGSEEWVKGIPYGERIRPYLENFTHTIDVETAASQFQSALNIISTQLLSISLGLMNVLIVLVLTFFMTVEEQSIDEFIRSLFPSRYGEYISTRINAVKDQIGLWIRGQLLVSILATILSYIILVALGVEYALTLSIISGIAVVIPVVGRFAAWVITFPIVFNQSPVLALWMSILYLIIQQFESNIFVPYIMNKAVGLSPIILIFAMMVGGQFLGVLGWVLAIPIATIVAIFIKDYTSKER